MACLWVRVPEDFFPPARQQRLPRRVCHHDTHHKVRVRVRCAKSMKQRMESCRYCYTWTFFYLPNHCQGPWELPSTTSGFPFQKRLERAFYPLPIFETSPSPKKKKKTKKTWRLSWSDSIFLSWRMNPQTSFVKKFSEFIGSCSTFFYVLTTLDSLFELRWSWWANELAGWQFSLLVDEQVSKKVRGGSHQSSPTSYCWSRLFVQLLWAALSFFDEVHPDTSTSPLDLQLESISFWANG